MLIITIDVGGTGTKLNIYEKDEAGNESFKIDTIEDEKFQDKHSRKYSSRLTPEENTRISQEFVTSLVQLIDRVLTEASSNIDDIWGIGICVPTQVAEDGSIEEIPAFKIRNLHLSQELKKELQKKYHNNLNINIQVIQDVLMHTLGMYKALKSMEQTSDIKSLMVVSAGTAAGIGIRLDNLNNKYKLIYGSEFQFPANILRGYGIRWSIENQENPQECPDLGWKTAGKGIKNTFLERVIEILKSPTAIAVIQSNGQNIDNLYSEIINESNQGYHLARRIVIECLDSDNVHNYSDFDRQTIEKKIEHRFMTILDNFKNSYLIKKHVLENAINEQIIKPEWLKDQQIGPFEIHQAASEKGDLFAYSILEECAEILGLSLSVIIPIIQPEYLIFAGGVSKSHIWLNKVKEVVKGNTPKWYKKPDSEKCFLTADKIKPHFCDGATEVQLLGAVELILNSDVTT